MAKSTVIPPPPDGRAMWRICARREPSVADHAMQNRGCPLMPLYLLQRTRGSKPFIHRTAGEPRRASGGVGPGPCFILVNVPGGRWGIGVSFNVPPAPSPRSVPNHSRVGSLKGFSNKTMGDNLWDNHITRTFSPAQVLVIEYLQPCPFAARGAGIAADGAGTEEVHEAASNGCGPRCRRIEPPDGPDPA